MEALKGIVMVACFIAYEETRKRAEQEEKTGRILAEQTREWSDYHITAMFPCGAGPGAYPERARLLYRKAREIGERFDALERETELKAGDTVTVQLFGNGRVVIESGELLSISMEAIDPGEHFSFENPASHHRRMYHVGSGTYYANEVRRA